MKETYSYSYPDLRTFGWGIGLHRAPLHYEHPWLVVGNAGTFGFYTKTQARAAWKRVKKDLPKIH